MSSGELLGVVRPGGCLVVEGAGFEAAVQDADEPVGELAQRGVVFGAAGACAGRSRRGRRARRCSAEKAWVMRASMSRSLCTNRAATVFFLPEARVIGLVAGVVLAGLGRGVAVVVVAELGEHPGAEDRPQAGLGQDDLSVRVLAKMGLDLPLQGLDLLVEGGQDRDQGAHRGGVGGGDHRRAGPGARRAARPGSPAALAAMSRRRARLSAALIWRDASAWPPTPGRAPWPAAPGCRRRRGRRTPPARPGSTPAARAAAAGCARVRSQISVLCVRATTLTASAWALSPATGRSWWASVRTMSASMCASAGVALGARHAVPFPVPGRLQRVDREHRVPGRDQRLHPRTPVGLDPDHHLATSSVVLAELLADHRVQPGDPRHALGQPGLGQPAPGGVHHLHVVVVLGPVIPDEQQPQSPVLRHRSPRAGSQRENHQRPNEAVLTPTPGGHDIPSAINSPGHRQGHDLSSGLNVQDARVLTCRRLPGTESAGRPTR